MNFKFVTDRVATGSAIADSGDIKTLISAGITHIIDCRDDFNDGPLLANNPGIAYIWNGTPDDGQLKPPSWFQTSLNFALPALSLPHYKVYAHCTMGINRGPSTAYAILRALGFEPIIAESLICVARPITIMGLRYKSDADNAIEVLGYD